jgi:arylsulfatase A-like enzyme
MNKGKIISEHVKVAVFAGILVGNLFGIVGLLARVMASAFEYFELYQTIMISIGIMVVTFLAILIPVEIINHFGKRKVSVDGLYVFYLYSLLPFLSVLINFGQRGGPDLTSIYFLAPLILYILLLTKGMKLKKVIPLIRKKGVDKVVGNIVFFIVVFILLSLVIDLAILIHIPTSTSTTALESPNVIVITLDTVRADHMSLYGYDRSTTPNLDTFSENAIVFENAISPSSWTIPSHASIFTGKYPSNHNATHVTRFLRQSETTLAEILSSAGYNTAGFVGGGHSKAKYGFGQGFLTYRDRMDFFGYVNTYSKYDLRQAVIDFFRTFYIDIDRIVLNVDRDRASPEINQDVFNWLEINRNNPFFIFINYFDAHTPYNLGNEFRHLFTDQTTPYEEAWREIPVNRGGPVSFESVNYVMDLYDTEIRFQDHHLGNLFNKLEELDLIDNTVILITSDHGEEFYEHGFFQHSQTLYEEVIHVPLIVHYPEFEPNRIEQRVGITNIFPTVLEMVNITLPEDIDSVSLLPLLKNETGYDRDYVFAELFGNPMNIYEPPEQYAIYSGDWKLIELSSQFPRIPTSLFNLEDDPHEINNLYSVDLEQRDALRNLKNTIQ